MTIRPDIDAEDDAAPREECGVDRLEALAGFGLPDGRWLCLECALARGGEYDSAEDRWTRAPDLAGIAELAP
ncbi:MAG: hypothetical protein AB7P00_10175 [Sandaracinaceae bacterium]